MTAGGLAGWEAGSAGSALLLAALLGLRHATDPDHLAAVATLAGDTDAGGARGAARLGLACGFSFGTGYAGLAFARLVGAA